MESEKFYRMCPNNDVLHPHPPILALLLPVFAGGIWPFSPGVSRAEFCESLVLYKGFKVELGELFNSSKVPV
jgi:hypothetical protein